MHEYACVQTIRRHFKRNWARRIRPDLVAWAERHNWEEGESAGTGSHTSGQIMRGQWFRAAIGAGAYKRFMMQLVARMDEALEAVRDIEAEGEGELDAKMPAKGAAAEGGRALERTGGSTAAGTGTGTGAAKAGGAASGKKKGGK
jgi:hypothetical protein